MEVKQETAALLPLLCKHPAFLKAEEAEQLHRARGDLLKLLEAAKAHLTNKHSGIAAVVHHHRLMDQMTRWPKEKLERAFLASQRRLRQEHERIARENRERREIYWTKTDLCAPVPPGIGTRHFALKRALEAKLREKAPS